MGEHEAVVQIGSIAITSGLVVAVLKWFVPFIIDLWFNKKQESIIAERKNTAMAVELEALRQKNAAMQMAHMDEVVKLHSAQMMAMGGQLNGFAGQVEELKRALSHTDGQLAQIIPYMPVLERISDLLRKVDEKAKHPQAQPAPASRSEQVPIGKDSVLVRTKKAAE